MNRGTPAARPTTGLVLEVTADKVMVLTREGIFLEVPRRDIAGDVVAGATVAVELGPEWFAAGGGQAPEAEAAPPARETAREAAGDAAGDAAGAAGAGRAEPAVAAVPRRRLLASFRQSWRDDGVRRRLAVQALGAAAAAALLFTAGLSLYRQAAVVYQVAVEINPSVILEVNAYDRVVRSRAGNADGEAVLRAVDLKGMTVPQAVRALVATLKDLGYLPAVMPEQAPAAEQAASPGGPGGSGPVSDPAAPPLGDAFATGSALGSTGEIGSAGIGSGAGVPDPILAISIIARSGPRAAARDDAVIQAVETSLLDAAAETGTSFDAVVQVVSADEVKRARQKTGNGGSLARAVLAEKARSRGVELSDEEITAASVPELARIVGQGQDQAGETGDQGQSRDRYQVRVFRVQPRAASDDGDGGHDDRRGAGALRNSRGRTGSDDDDDRRGPNAGWAGRGTAAGQSTGGDDDDDRRQRGRGIGGRLDRDRDDDGDRARSTGPGRRDERARDDDRSGDRRGSRNQGDDDRRSDRGGPRGRGGGDDDRPGRGRSGGDDRWWWDDSRWWDDDGRRRADDRGRDRDRDSFNRFMQRLPLFNGFRSR